MTAQLKRILDSVMQYYLHFDEDHGLCHSIHSFYQSKRGVFPSFCYSWFDCCYNLLITYNELSKYFLVIGAIELLAGGTRSVESNLDRIKKSLSFIFKYIYCTGMFVKHTITHLVYLWLCWSLQCKWQKYIFRWRCYYKWWWGVKIKKLWEWSRKKPSSVKCE